VLVVDDEPDTRDSSAAALEQAGASVLAVGSVAEALAGLEWRPAVVLSDIAMPGQDGFSLVRALRAREPALPTVALTAYASEHDRRRVLAAGYDAYLVKPVDPADLVAAVRRVVPTRPAARAR
jgi:CheY-like chemotaxis protein